MCNVCFLSQRAIGLGGLKTSKLHVLKNVSGVLTPVSPHVACCSQKLYTDLTSAACVTVYTLLAVTEHWQHSASDLVLVPGGIKCKSSAAILLQYEQQIVHCICKATCLSSIVFHVDRGEQLF